MDYFFLKDIDEKDTVTCLAMRESESRVTFADACPKKGASEYAVGQAAYNIRRMGLKKVTIKTDQEPALIALAEGVRNERKSETIIEHSPVAESASNGMIEKAVQQVEEQIRVLKLALQNRIKAHIPSHHPTMTWLISHSADMLTKFEVGSDGRTPCERLRKKKYTGEVVEFGSSVHFRHAGALQPNKTNLEPRWSSGIWLGKRWGSDEHLVGTPTGIAKSRAIAQKPADERWDRDAIFNLRGVLWAWTGDSETPGVIFRPIDSKPEPRQLEPPAPIPRQPKITQEILDKYGYTTTCARCRGMVSAGPIPTRAREDHCRRRIEQAIAEDEKFGEKLQANKRKLEEFKSRTTSRAPDVAEGGGGEPASSSSKSSSSGTTGTPHGLPQDEEEPQEPVTRRQRVPTIPTKEELRQQQRRDTTPPTFDPASAMPGVQSPSSTTATGGHNARIDDNVDENMEVEDQEEAMRVLMSLGMPHERAKAPVLEIYSPPRVTAAAGDHQNLGMIPGFALDITTNDSEGQPYDFDIPEQREKARRLLTEHRPFLLIGSPMCTAFSIIQALNWGRMDAKDKDKIIERAATHLHFCLELYKLQAKAGRYYLHEHPASATSWRDTKVKKFIERSDTLTTVMHMCQYGMMSRRPDGTIGPVYKPTKWMSNSPQTIARLFRRCSRGQHQRVHLLGGRAAGAAVYPPDLCLQILQGIRDQMQHDDAANKRAGTVTTENNINEMSSINSNDITDELNGFDRVDNNTKFYDDMTGEPLPKDLVMKARAEDIEFFHRKSVYKAVDKDLAYQQTGKPPITIRWLYVNKGDREHPDIRARLVAREIRTEVSDGSMFAATPPPESVKWLLSLAAPSPQHIGTRRELKVSFIDARRAYFNAHCDEEMFVDLPHEDHQHGKCGKSLRWMYGTRGAASKWEDHYSRVLVRAGFVRGTASSCTFWHPPRQLRCVVHGDDSTTLGTDEKLDWLQNIISKSFEVKIRGRIGSGRNDDKEVRLLNRIVRRTEEGCEWEPDPRNSELIIQHLGMENAKPVNSPGAKIDRTVEQDEEELHGEEATAYRAVAARANFLFTDRADVQVSSKEICRRMSKPRRCDWQKLRRLSRYLAGQPRMVQFYRWQDTPDMIDAVVDTDFAGCLETRKSTSGGTLLHGHHCIKTWSSTQSVIALSSGEAELYGVVKGASAGLGFQSIATDLGIKLGLEIFSDSAAARGIMKRSGPGKVRHIHVQELWVQQALKEGRSYLSPISGEDNPADILTKYLGNQCLTKHCQTLGLEPRIGRSDTAPTITGEYKESATHSEGTAAGEECEVYRLCPTTGR